MAESENGYKVGPGRPPLHTRFQKGQSGNLGGRSTKSLPALLADALNETVVVTIDGRRRKLTKREAIVTQMVDKSASADLHATKMLIDIMKDVEHKAGDAAPPPEPRRLAAADKEVLQLFVARLRRQILQEIEEAKPAEPSRIALAAPFFRSWPPRAPVCPYPVLPRYTGVGDPTKAESFVCVDDGQPIDNQPATPRYLDDGDNYPIVPIDEPAHGHHGNER